MWGVSKNFIAGDIPEARLTGKYPEGAYTFKSKNMAIIMAVMLDFSGGGEFIINPYAGANAPEDFTYRPVFRNGKRADKSIKPIKIRIVFMVGGYIKNILAANPVKDGYLYKLDADRNIVKSYYIEDFTKYKLWRAVSKLYYGEVKYRLDEYVIQVKDKYPTEEPFDPAMPSVPATGTGTDAPKFVWNRTRDVIKPGNEPQWKTMWHSSPVNISGDYLLPHPSSVGSYVYASNVKYMTMVYMGQLSRHDYSFYYDFESERWVMIELVPGFFEQQYMNKSGYIYSISAEGFEGNPKLNQYIFINPNPVKILKRTFVPNIWTELQKTPIIFIRYETLFDIGILLDGKRDEIIVT